MIRQDKGRIHGRRGIAPPVSIQHYYQLTACLRAIYAEGRTYSVVRKGWKVDMSVRGASYAVAIAAVFFAVILCSGHAWAYNPGDPEFRGFWVDAWGAGAMNQGEVDNLLGVVGNGSSKGQIRNNNCNAVLLQVRRNCDANYPSSMGEPYMSGLSPSNFNALQAVINAAHDTTGGKSRIEVHAWIVTFRTSGGQVFQNHDDPPTGSLDNLDNYWPTLTDQGTLSDDVAFDPGHPLAQQYTVDVAMDLVNNFDVDGIHFDYVRFTAGNQGYNPTSVNRYNARYAQAGNPVYTDERWRQWRRDQVTSVIRKVFAKVQSSKPWVKVSGSMVTWNPSPWSSTREAFQGTRPYYDVFCDWDSWLQEGIIDCAMPMTYYDLGGSYPNDWARWMNFEKDRHGNRHMYIGPGLYLNSLSNAITELLQTRDASPAGNYADGWCGYSYRTPYSGGNWATFAPQLLSQVTSTPAAIPDMPWKTNPTHGHISGTVTIAATGKWCDGVTVTLTGPENRSMICDGTGFYCFANLIPGTYSVVVSKPTFPDHSRSVNVQIGQVTGNMYVTDIALEQDPNAIITNVQASGVTQTTATITWDTDVPADSLVQYGTSTQYGYTTPRNPAMVTSHSVTLTGLTPGYVYHYRVISNNGNGDGISGDYTFLTNGPPQITNVAASNITASSATITWSTSTASSSGVNYGTTAAYGSQASDPAAVTIHTINLTGLSPNTIYHYQAVSTNEYGTSYSSDRMFTTSGPPVLSAVVSSNIGTTTATITWTTDQASDSRVSYGTTMGYGLQVTDSSPVTSHSISLSGLIPGTVYHYQCASSSANGTGVSTNRTFTTVALPSEIVMDENDAVRSGTWTVVTSAGNDGDYAYANCRRTSANATCRWTPSIQLAGNYDVYCWYPTISGGTPSAKVKYTVNYSGGSATVTLDQGSNRDTWVKIATGVPFAAGTGGDVYLDNYTTETSGSRRVLADAVKFVYVPPAPADIIVDDVDPGATKTGSWSNGTFLTGSWNDSYKFCYNDISNETASHKWTPSIPATGLYDVYCWYTTGGNRTTNAHYTIQYANGSASAFVNQTGNGAQWVKIGSSLPFSIGSAGYVKMDNITGEATDSKVLIADAMKWVYVGSVSGDISQPTVQMAPPSTWLTRTGPVGYVVNYSDDVGVTAITLTPADVTLHRTGTADGVITIAGEGLAARTVTVTSITGTGTLGVSVAAGTARDAAGNTAPAIGPSASFTVDNTIPTISIGAPSVSSTKAGPVTYTISYGGADAVTLTTANITLNKTGTANGVVGVSGTGLSSRTVTISSVTGSGTLGISVAAATASDAAGNAAPAAGPSETFAIDNTAPTVSISAPSAAYASSGPVTYTITYGGADSITLSSANVTLNATGTAAGAVAVSGSGNTTRTVTISSITGNGSLGISIAAGTATDIAGNIAPAAGPSGTFVVDNTPPSVVIYPPSATRTTGGPVSYFVDYTTASTITLSSADVTLNTTGTATGSVSVSGSGTSRTVTISSITGDGTIGISIAAGTASDAAGNSAPAAGPSGTFAVDNTPPTIAVVGPSVATTGTAPVSYMVNYTGADSVTLTEADITLVKTGTANGTVSVAGFDNTSRTVTISSITGDGTLGISVAAGSAVDDAGNAAPAASSATAVVVDNTAPAVAISAPSTASTSDGPVTYTVTYTGAEIVTLSAADIVLNSTGGATAAIGVSGSGSATRTVTISLVSGSGTLGISIPGGTATDAAGNAAPAAGPSGTFVVDNEAPSIAISAPSLSQTTAGPVSYTITYTGASWINLQPTQVILNKTGTADGTVTVSGTDNTTRTVTISSIGGSGTLGISLISGTAFDDVGNGAAEAGPSATFSVDNSAPVMTQVRDEGYTTSTASLYATWFGSDPESGITRYEYAVGTNNTTNLSDVVGWTDAGTSGSANITGLSLTVGQRYYVSVRATNGLGLTCAPMTSSGVWVCHAVHSVKAAKALENGKPVAIYTPGGAPPSLAVSAKFGSAFYIEDADRGAGIRVHDFQTNLVAGNTAVFYGVLGVTSSGERCVGNPKIANPTSGVAIAPLAMSGKAIGGGMLGYTPGVTGGIGLNTTGLLVKTAGLVTHELNGVIYVDGGVGITDESDHPGIRVSGVTQSRSWQGCYVTVTGVVSTRKVGDSVYPTVLATNVVEP